MFINKVYYVHFAIFLFLYSNKMLVFGAGIHKMLVRIANREDPYTQSELGVCAVCVGVFSRHLVLEIL